MDKNSSSSARLPGTDSGFTARLEEVFAQVAETGSGWSEKDKGDWLEQAVVKTLNSEDGRRLWNLEWAVLWADWNGKNEMVADGEGGKRRKYPEQDLGIDIVAKERTGRHVAVQVKARPEDHKLLKSDLSEVLAMAVPEDWEKVMVVHTGRSLSPEAKKLAELHKDRLTVLSRQPFARYCDEWRMEFPGLGERWPQVIASRPEKFDLRPHQQAAVNDVLAGFAGADRGKLIMPCGSGKTFTSQKAAESLVGAGGAVLVAVPSISLLSQSMREWSAQQNGVRHRYLGVCSDVKAGRAVDDEFMQSIYELDVPVTTDAEKLAEGMAAEDDETMLVVFATYQSLDKVRSAQQTSGRVFDLALCDEAHRTTGLAEAGQRRSKKAERELSQFRRIHDPDWLKVERRLYLTATPKIYTDPTSKNDLTAEGDNVFSMSDEAVYGRDFHHLTFAAAVEQDLLSPYRVVLVGIRDEAEAENLRDHIVAVRSRQEEGDVEIDAELAAKILGSTKFAANYSSDREDAPRPGEGTLKKLLVFANSIAASKAAQVGFDYGDDMLADLDDEWDAHGVEVEARHVDGTMAADERDQHLGWLRKSTDPNLCRVLTNARCLTEGIDVPALDGCVFLEGRKSKIDVVQAVGRIMRKAKGKECGWIILPVLTSVPEDMTDADQVEQQQYISKQWKPAWDVLRALAAHDDDFRLEVAVTAAGLAAGQRPERGCGKLVTAGTLDPEACRDSDRAEQEMFNQLALGDWEQVSSLIYTVVVTQLGGTKDLNKAGVQAGKLIDGVRSRIRGIKRSDNEAAKQALDVYWEGMKAATSSDVLTKEDVDTMLAQHVVMEPVFAAFFSGGQFKTGNPVSQILGDLLSELRNAGFELQAEAEAELAGFYRQVERTVEKMETPAEFQGYLKEVYNAFFRTAFRETADKLGIAYTPIEIVDFINRSADWASRQAFGKGVGDRGVGIMDPFTGTGTFLARMLADPELIPDDTIRDKYRGEIYAYELVLLAYYIASVNIEHAYHERTGGDSKHHSDPFTGIVLHDTFAGYGMENRMTGLDGNSRRARKIEAQDVEIVVSNPPYSGGQRNASEDNPNIVYDNLLGKIKTDVAGLITQNVTSKTSLYNLYVHALVWAEHRLRNKGVLSFVMPADWMRTKAGEGLRRWVEAKFSQAWILDLAGNARTSGETWQREGGSVFPGGETTSPIGIYVLIKDPSETGPCDIRYRRVQDYTSGADKRAWVEQFGSIAGVGGWDRLACNEYGEWFGDRDADYMTWIPVASKSCKAGKDDNAIFRMHSLGLSSGRDYLAFNSDRGQLEEMAAEAVEHYEHHRRANIKPDPTRDVDIFKWGRRALDCLQQNGGEGAPASFNPETDIRSVLYRPFFPQWAHWEPLFNARHYQLGTLFPAGNATGRDDRVQRDAVQREAFPTGMEDDQFSAAPSGRVGRSVSDPLAARRRGRRPEGSLPCGTTSHGQRPARSDSPTTTTWLEGGQPPPHSPDSPTAELRDPQSTQPRPRLSSHSRQRVQQLQHHVDLPAVDIPLGRTQGASSAQQMAITWSRGQAAAVATPTEHIFHGPNMTSLLPRFVFRRSSPGGVFDAAAGEAPDGWERVDNITDTALALFRSHYGDEGIDKDAIFFYVYGLLHHPSYLADHKTALEAELPRVPLAPDFEAFRDAGYRLFRLHVGYADLEGYPLEMRAAPGFDAEDPNSYEFSNVRWADKSDKTALVVNDRLTVAGIPRRAHDYKLNGLSPLDWIAKQYVVTHHYADPETGKIKKKATGDPALGADGLPLDGPVNDPNALFGDGYTIADLIAQATQTAVESADLVDGLAALPYRQHKADGCPPRPATADVTFHQ